MQTIHDMEHTPSAHEVCDLLLDMGTLLLGSGAHCGRVDRNLNRVAGTWGYRVELLSTFTGLLITVYSTNGTYHLVTGFKYTGTPAVNFDTIQQVSLASWRVCEQHRSATVLRSELHRIRHTPRHPWWQVMLGVGCACGSLCMVAGGSWHSGVVALVAAMVGFAARHMAMVRQLHIMAAVAAGAFVSSLISGLGVYLGIGAEPETALATSVLYLVPGVPLINSVIDLIEGHIPSGMVRALFSTLVLLSIAAGMTLSILLLGVDNF